MYVCVCVNQPIDPKKMIQGKGMYVKQERT